MQCYRYEFTRLFDKYINVVQTVALVIAIALSMYQASENTKALEQQEYGALIQQQQEIFSMQIENSDIYVRSLLEPSTLSASELWKVTEIIYLRLELLERFQRAHDNGIIPLDDLSDEYSDASIYLGTPIGRLVWKTAKVDYGLHFVNTIEENLKRKNAVKPDNIFFRSLHNNYLKEFRSQSESNHGDSASGT